MRHLFKKRSKDKWGQLHITETIAVLFIFFVLVLFGIIFYSQYSKAAFKEKQQELLGNRAIDVTLRTLYLPELLCTKGDAEPESDCFDLMKLRSLNQTIARSKDTYYYDLFGYSRIVVTQLYPVQQEYVLYDRPKPEFTQKEPTFYIVALRDELLGTFSYGYVTVEVYA